MDRADVFRRQLAAWATEGRPGVPFLHVPGTEPRAGACVSCGEPRAPERLRCEPCLHAVTLALWDEAEEKP
jgi:hypothetical protein